MPVRIGRLLRRCRLLPAAAAARRCPAGGCGCGGCGAAAGLAAPTGAEPSSSAINSETASGAEIRIGVKATHAAGWLRRAPPSRREWTFEANDNIGRCASPERAQEDPSCLQEALDHVQPLTVLAEDERIFRDSVREFAEAQVRPLVREMDEHAKIPRALIDQLFELGVMGIEVPERYGGAGGRFFHSVLAVEELSRVDPSVGVLVDVQNTLVINALLRWGNDDIKQRYLPRLAASTVGAYALSEAGSGSDAFALTTRAREDGDGYVLTGRKLWITNANEADLFIVFANGQPGGRLPRHHRVPRRARLRRVHGRQEGRQARHPRQQHVRADPRGLPRAGARTCSARSARATRSRSRR